MDIGTPATVIRCGILRGRFLDAAVEGNFRNQVRQARTHTSPIHAVVVHRTQTTEEPIPLAAERIDRMHRQRGWLGIGYHFLVNESTGECIQTRSLDVMGAHAKGANNGTIGVGILGYGRSGRDRVNLAVRSSEAVLLERLLLVLPRGVSVLNHREVGTTKTDCGDDYWKASLAKVLGGEP